MKKLLILSSILIAGCQTGSFPSPVITPTLTPAEPTPSITTSPVPSVTPTGPSATPSPAVSVSPKPSPSSPIPNSTSSPSPSPSSDVGSLGAIDVTALFQNVKAGQTLTLTPKGGSFLVTKSVQISVDNLTIDLNGGSIAFNATPGANTVLPVYGKNFTFGNGHVTRANVTLIGSHADGTHIHDLVTDSLVYSGGKIVDGVNQIFLGGIGSTNADLKNITTGLGATVTFYWSADNAHFTNIKCGGSIGEYCFREDLAATGQPIPKGAVLDGIYCDNSQNKYNKDCMGFRYGSATLKNSVIAARDIRVGQIYPPGPTLFVGSNVPSFVMDNVTFNGVGQQPALAIDRGVVATISNCKFVRADIYHPISIDMYSKVTLTGNTIVNTVNGVKARGLWTSSSNPAPSVTEANTTNK